MTTKAARGSDPSAQIPFALRVYRDHPMAIPSGCLCTWVVRHNRIWVLKFQSDLCPFKGNH